MKMTSLGRQPTIIKSGISQQPLIGSCSDLKLKLRWPNHIFKSSKWRRLPMENNLRVLKMEYQYNHCMDCDLWVLRGKLEENSEEILSVALLCPACKRTFKPQPRKLQILCSGFDSSTRTNLIGCDTIVNSPSWSFNADLR